MAEESSVLTMDSISAVLQQEYGLEACKAEKLSIGTANCFCVFTAEKKLFLKEFPKRFQAETVEREALLLDYLVKNGYPTLPLCKTRSGSHHAMYADRVITLQPWGEGITYADGVMPKPLLLQSATLLARLHGVLQGYPLPRDMDTEWITSFSAVEHIGKYDTLLGLISPDVPHAERMTADLIYKRGLAAVAAEWSGKFDGLTYGASHGDYSSQQLLCNGDVVTAVIDFSTACELPLSWEIMRSYMQSSAACRNGNTFDLQELCEYVKRYLAYAPLSANDLYCMPYIYLYQLIRSDYGYKQYLKDASRSHTQLLNFAFWRTQVCRTLIPQVEMIAKTLEKLV